MNIFKKFIGFNSERIVSKRDLLDHEICPNCWGRQEYDNLFYKEYGDFMNDKMSTVSSDRKAFIAKFVDTHVSGIKLKKMNGKRICPDCNGKF